VTAQPVLCLIEPNSKGQRLSGFFFDWCASLVGMIGSMLIDCTIPLSKDNIYFQVSYLSAFT